MDVICVISIAYFGMQLISDIVKCSIIKVPWNETAQNRADRLDSHLHQHQICRGSAQPAMENQTYTTTDSKIKFEPGWLH